MQENLPKQTNEVTLLHSYDVINLYTNVGHDYGLEAITF